MELFLRLSPCNVPLWEVLFCMIRINIISSILSTVHCICEYSAMSVHWLLVDVPALSNTQAPLATLARTTVGDRTVSSVPVVSTAHVTNTQVRNVYFALVTFIIITDRCHRQELHIMCVQTLLLTYQNGFVYLRIVFTNFCVKVRSSPHLG